jgi:hypothetical protein
MRQRIGLAAAVAVALGPALAYMRIIPGVVGFALFALGGILCLLVGVASLVAMLRGRSFGAGGAAAVIVGALFVVIALRGAGAPPINDFTTDPRDPPAFRHAGTLAANVGRDMSYPPAFAAVQQSCCADLHGARIAGGKEAVFARTKRTAEIMPSWEITLADADAGTIEAVATTRLFGFHDDIVIRLREQGDGTILIDMRSKSRDGKGDIGANAARIRQFIALLNANA